MKNILDVEKEIVDEKVDSVKMNLATGDYLGKEICAFYKDWLIVYDGKYNYMLFSTGHRRVIWRYKKGWMPTNDVDRGTKDVEYYSNFDNALDGLAEKVFSCKVIGYKEVVNLICFNV